MKRSTVLGAHGFVGRAVTAVLRNSGREVVEVGRGEDIPRSAGDLFYCAGTTADFRTRTFDTIEAHVSLLNRVLAYVDFNSLTYLSSTRVYLGAKSGREDARVIVDPCDAQYIYNLSKLTGECLCLADSRPSVKVVRLSNVYGPGDTSSNFISTLLAAARRGEPLEVLSGRKAAKDYVWIGDAVAAIARVPELAQSRLLNIASGECTSNEVLAKAIASLYSVEVRFSGADLPAGFPPIDTSRMIEELLIKPSGLSDCLERC